MGILEDITAYVGVEKQRNLERAARIGDEFRRALHSELSDAELREFGAFTVGMDERGHHMITLWLGTHELNVRYVPGDDSPSYRTPGHWLINDDPNDSRGWISTGYLRRAIVREFARRLAAEED